jgi:AcrR family transcriptional regulator
MNEGPDGLRLKSIADDVGLSHSAILHHFGSREALIEAVRVDGFAALAEDLRQRLAEPTEGDPAIAFFEKVAQTLGEHGYGRLLAWQLMSGQLPSAGAVGEAVLGPDGSGGLLDGLARPLHTLRTRRFGECDLQETRFIILLVACALLGESIAGDVLVRSAGLEEGEASRKAFRAWLAKQTESIALRRPPVPGEPEPTAAPGESRATESEA